MRRYDVPDDQRAALLGGHSAGLPSSRPTARVREDAATTAGQVLGQPEQVLPWAELRLVLDAYGTGDGTADPCR